MEEENQDLSHLNEFEVMNYLNQIIERKKEQVGIIYKESEYEDSSSFLKLIEKYLIASSFWQLRLIEQGLKEYLQIDEVLSSIFHFHTSALNYLKSCPYFLIPKIYHGSLIQCYLQNFEKFRELSISLAFLNRLNLQALVADFVENLKEVEVPPNLISDINKSSIKDKFIAQCILKGVLLDYIGDGEGNFVKISVQSMLKIEELIQNKQPSGQLAESIIYIHDRVSSSTQLDLILRVVRFWDSTSLISVGSEIQQLYVSYLVYSLMKKQNVTIDSDEELLQRLRNGITIRLEKVQNSKSIYNQGMLVWKQFMDQSNIKLDEDMEDEDEDHFTMNIDSDMLFQPLFSLQEPFQGAQPLSLPVEPLLQQSFYNEEDSDNESDFDVKYDMKEDRFEDLKEIKKPLFLKDLMLGLTSDNHERFNMSVEVAEKLIRDSQANDLDFLCRELLSLLFRIQNKYSTPTFTLSKFNAIQAVLEKQPYQASQIVMQRLLDEEASLGEKLLLIEVLGNAVVGLSDQQPQESDLFYQEELKKMVKEENSFFETQQLSDLPMEMVGKIKRKLTSTKIVKGKKNAFLNYAENFIFPLVHLLESGHFKNSEVAISKILFSLATMMECARNHWKTYDISNKILQLFMAMRIWHESSPEILITLCFLSSKIRFQIKKERDEVLDWIDEVVVGKLAGGNEAIIEVAMFVKSTLMKQEI